jgi:hypothetical protein
MAMATIVPPPDNVLTLIGNGKIFSDSIQNFSSLPHRRVCPPPGKTVPVHAGLKAPISFAA